MARPYARWVREQMERLAQGLELLPPPGREAWHDERTPELLATALRDAPELEDEDLRRERSRARLGEALARAGGDRALPLRERARQLDEAARREAERVTDPPPAPEVKKEEPAIAPAREVEVKRTLTCDECEKPWTHTKPGPAPKRCPSCKGEGGGRSGSAA